MNQNVIISLSINLARWDFLSTLIQAHKNRARKSSLRNSALCHRIILVEIAYYHGTESINTLTSHQLFLTALD